MTDLTKLSLCEARKGLLDRKFSSVELTQSFLSRIDEKNKKINAYITVCHDHALKMAKDSDDRLAKAKPRRMEGLPIALKDNFLTKDIKTTAGSKILGNFIPPYESVVGQNLLNEGNVLLGKTNMDEFAMGSANITSAYGPCINPWRSTETPEKDLVPGGSSGGSASAVAAHLCLAATGTDTGGSIRQPAALTGTVGIKPTYGLCSRRGIVSYASSLDQAGPMTKTVDDAAFMLRYMAGFDIDDATSVNVNIPDYMANLKADVKGKKVGIPKEYTQSLDADEAAFLQKGMDWLKSAGAEVIEMSLPMTEYALPAYYIIAPAEASANLARFDGVRYGTRVTGKSIDDMYRNTREEGFGWEVKRRILIGTYVLSAGYMDAYYYQAQKIQKLISEDFNNAFKSVDLILTPTTKGPAFGINDKKDPVDMYMNDIFTVTVNMAGLPGISLPAGLSHDGLPLGLQLIGPRFSEQSILNAAKVIENAAEFKPLD